MSRSRGGRSSDQGPYHDLGHEERHRVARRGFTPESFFKNNAEPASGGWRGHARISGEPAARPLQDKSRDASGD